MNDQEIVQTAKAHGVGVDIIKSSLQIEEIVQRCTPEALATLPPTVQTVALAKGMKDLRDAMTEEIVKKLFMPLMGSKLGFRTDHDSKDGYPWEIVRDCVTEAMLRGLKPTGNEFNIIGGNCYTTLEAYERKVREFPGLEGLQLTPGVPQINGQSGLVPYSATWFLNGKPDSLECTQRKTEDGEVVDNRIPVRVNNNQIVDAVMGKAKRKFLARLFERISGTQLPGGESDADVIDTVGEAVKADKPAKGTDSATQDLINKHRGKAKGSKGKTDEAPPETVDTTAEDPALDSDGNPMPGADG